MRDIAATVSVAHSTVLSSINSLSVSASSKTKRLMMYTKVQIRRKARMVPITPKKLMIPKF